MSPDRTTCWPINLLPYSRSHYFHYLCSVLSFFTYQTNGRSTPVDVRTWPTNELTNQKFVKIRFSLRRQLDPAWPVKILKWRPRANQKLTSSSASHLIGHSGSLSSKTAKTNKVWQYIDPSKKKDKLPTLEPPKRPTPADVRPMATLITQLEQDQFAVYN